MTNKLFVLIFFFISLIYSQTGKINGTIIDQSTQQPLPGVNVIVEGSVLGAASDVSG
jgi:hypothetical protein